MCLSVAHRYCIKVAQFLARLSTIFVSNADYRTDIYKNHLIRRLHRRWYENDSSVLYSRFQGIKLHVFLKVKYVVKCHFLLPYIFVKQANRRCETPSRSKAAAGDLRHRAITAKRRQPNIRKLERRQGKTEPLPQATCKEN